MIELYKSYLKGEDISKFSELNVENYHTIWYDFLKIFQKYK